MKVNRGDVVLVPIHFTSGSGSKIRPVLVVQSNRNNQRLHDTIVAVITSTTHRAAREATQLFVDPASSDGFSTGLLHPSAITCERLHTVAQESIQRKIGDCPHALMLQIDDCLKAALDIR